MKLVQIYDSAGRIAQIDYLVEQGEYSSKTEVYRTGAFLLLIQNKARDLSHKAQLDPIIFEKHIKKCLNAIKTKNNNLLLDELRYVINGITFRELTSLLLGEEDDRVTFETLRDGLQNYEKTLMIFDTLDTSLQEKFYTQLENDVKTLEEYIKEQTNVAGIKETISDTMREYLGWHSAAIVNWNDLSSLTGGEIKREYPVITTAIARGHPKPHIRKLDPWSNYEEVENWR